ncbi:MAG: hypothetical protein JWL90_3800 [Chthoniobacteraceae bacterium]|nr:hypothetical protein [Chthoniobacteraceae bacterium]
MLPRVFFLLLLSLPALSAELTWGPTGNGGSGTWDITTPNWFDGTNAVPWPTNGGSAIFDGTPGTVTMTGFITADNLEFRTAGYVLEGLLLNSGAKGLTINTLADVTSNVSTSPGIFEDSRIFTKTGPASLTLSSLNFFDQVNILSGEVRAATNSGVDSAEYFFNPAETTRLTLGGYVGDTFTVGGLQGSNAEIYPLDSSLSGSAGKRILSILGRSHSFSGTLRDNGANVLELEKYTVGQQELAGPNTYSGPTTIHAGVISLAGAGSALNTAFTVNSDGTLLLDNTAVAKSDRISDSAVISIGGTLTLKGNSQAPVAETAGNLTSQQIPLIQVLANPAQPATLTFQSLVTSSTALPVFAGTNLGMAAGPGVAGIRFVNVPALVGGGGTEGSSTLSILPGAYGGKSGPESLLTYGTNGLRPLAESEYLHDSLAGGTSANIALALPLSFTGAQSLNALRMQDGSSLSGGDLTIASGALLVLPGESRLLQNSVNFGNATGTLFTVGNLTITSVVTGTNGLRKSGLGTLVLGGSNSYTGVTHIIAGTLRLENALALGSAANGTTVYDGGALELAGGLAIGNEPLFLAGTGPLGLGALRSLGGENAWSGNISGISNIRVETGSLALSGNLTGSLVKSGAGLLTLSGDTTSLGVTVVNGGTVRSRATADVVFGGSLTRFSPLGQRVVLNNGRLEIAPAGANKDIAISLAAIGGSVTYSGNSTLVLDRGQNSSLTVTIGSALSNGNAIRRSNGTLVIVPASGQLGTTEKLKGNSSAFPQRFGLVTPTIVLEEADTQRSASFLSYNSTAGLIRATSSAPPGSTLQTAGASSYFVANTPQTLAGPASVYAIQNQGQTIDLATSTLTLSSSASGVAGLILNGGSIRGGALNFPSGGAIYTSLAGATIASPITTTASLAFFGPGILTLTNHVSFSPYAHDTFVNSGTLKLDGHIDGSVFVAPQATLTGAGKIDGIIAGGHLSPGNGAAILTASQVDASKSLPTSASPLGPISFAFEFSGTGLSDFSHATQSGNDLLRLTNPVTPFTSFLDSENEIALYFQTDGLHFGDQFQGGFYNDLRADFADAVKNATFHIYSSDPAGTVLFGGQHYSLNENVDVAVTTVPLSADFGAGQIDGQIMQVRVIPEPSTAALLAVAFGLAASMRRRKEEPSILG